MRLIDADELFELVGNIKPNNNQQYADIGMFMNMITNSPTVERPHGEWTTESAIDYLMETGWLPEHDRILTERPPYFSGYYAAIHDIMRLINDLEDKRLTSMALKLGDE